MFRLIEEAVRRYDCDGIELDFQRFPTFFKGGTTAERVAKINGLVARVADMLDAEGTKRGRRLVLAARIPSDYGRSAPSLRGRPRHGLRPGGVGEERLGRLPDRLRVPLRPRTTCRSGPGRGSSPNVPIYGGIECAEGGKREQCLTADRYRKPLPGTSGPTVPTGSTCSTSSRPESMRKTPFEPPFEVLKEIGGPRNVPAASGSPAGTFTLAPEGVPHHVLEPTARRRQGPRGRGRRALQPDVGPGRGARRGRAARSSGHADQRPA